MADKRRNALASPEMRETPVRNRLAQYAGNALTAVDEFARAPFGYQNPPAAMLSDALGVPAVASTLNRLAYGDRLTQGSGQTLQIRPDVLEAAMAAAPVAAKFPRATLGAAGMLAGAADTGAGRAMFIGANAKTWDAAAAAKAAQLEAAGKDARTIWKETGTFKGADGKWRQEIDDSASAMRNSNTTDPAMFADMMDEAQQRERGVSLGQAFDHNKLFSAYPTMPSHRFKVEGGPGASFDGKTIRVADPYGVPGGQDTRVVTLHELQHSVQDMENFARGGSPLLFNQQDAAEKARDLISWRREVEARMKEKPGLDWRTADAEMVKEYEAMGWPEGVPSPEVRKMAQSPSDYFDSPPEDFVKLYGLDQRTTPYSPMEAYKRLAGEAEARATEKRMNMNAKQRREVFPYDSYDVPVNSLIVR